MRNTRTVTVCILIIGLALHSASYASDSSKPSLESILTPDQQTALNIAAMSPQRREVLRQALIAAYTAGLQRGRLEAQRAAVQTRASEPPRGGVIETEIDGDFEGWEGETIVKLMNGQIWQQTEYHYEYSYAFDPQVLIYQSGGQWKMKVEGTDEAVGVQRLK
jgi:hypothetical protein